MKNIEDMKKDAARKLQKSTQRMIDQVIAMLETSNEFDAEAKLYFVKTLAQQTANLADNLHKNMHAANSAVAHDCDGRHVPAVVFERIFGNGL